MATLRILRERLESMQITCLNTLPKNATHSFLLSLICVSHAEARYVGDALDLSTIPLPGRLSGARQAHLSIRDDGERFLISVYTPK
jgi:hypothetical protein